MSTLIDERDDYKESDDQQSERWDRLEDEESREQDDIDRLRAHAE